jgi:hypothetical protein
VYVFLWGAQSVHDPTNDAYEDKCWKKHNREGFAAFARAFSIDQLCTRHLSLLKKKISLDKPKYRYKINNEPHPFFRLSSLSMHFSAS